jgi:hypothetical protein
VGWVAGVVEPWKEERGHECEGLQDIKLGLIKGEAEFTVGCWVTSWEHDKQGRPSPAAVL